MFSGELGQLSSRRSLVDAVAIGEVQTLLVEPEQLRALLIAEAALVDRSGGTVDLGVPFFALTAINFPTYAADELPPELAAIPAIKPGSRAQG